MNQASTKTGALPIDPGPEPLGGCRGSAGLGWVGLGGVGLAWVGMAVAGFAWVGLGRLGLLLL